MTGYPYFRKCPTHYFRKSPYHAISRVLTFPYFPGALRSSAGYALAAVGTASPALSPLQPEDLKRLKEQQTSTVSPQATGAGDLEGSPILFFVQYVHIYTYDSMI